MTYGPSHWASRQALEEVRRAGAERNAQALASWCFALGRNKQHQGIFDTKFVALPSKIGIELY